MAHRVNKLISASGPCDKFLVICGVGHSGYSHGVPERIFAHHAELEKQCFRIWCLHCDPAVDFSSQESVDNVLKEAFGPPGSSSPAEICLAFVEESVPLEYGSKASQGL